MNKVFSQGARVLISIFLACGLAGLSWGGVPEASAVESVSYAQPGPEDFEFSGGTLKKLKGAYVDSLSDAQKKDVRIVIPDEINGQKVTAIADMAFYSVTNSGLVFTSLDLSKTTALRSIGSSAFRYASRLTGDLILPDTLTEIGESAFANCGFDGSLHLPTNASFTTVSGQTFLETPFSGTLEIPVNVKSIQRKAFQGTNFSGELNIPEGITELWAAAFSDCKSIASVTIPSTVDFFKGSDSGHQFRNCSSLERVTFAENSSVTMLHSETFGGCSSLRVLELPDSITNIDGAAFRNSGLQTVYLPSNAVIAANTSSFLTTASNAVAVCEDEAAYEAYRVQLPANNQRYLGYPVTVSFDAGSYGSNPPSVERLVNQPFNRVKDESTGVWAVDSSYELPNLGSETQKTPWYSDAAKTTEVTASSKVSATALTLYAGPATLSDPILEYDDVFKTYDGEASYVSVKASHPLVKDPSEANEGDYAFYYAWFYFDETTRKWNNIGQGLSKFEVAVKDVADTGYYMSYTYFAQLQSGKWKLVSKPFSQQIAGVIYAAEPTVHAVLSADVESNLPGFPGLAVSDGDTPGTLAWNTGQTLVEGTNTYTWTFAPDPPAEGKPANYKTATGSIDLCVADDKIIHGVTFDSAGGTTFDPLDVAFGDTLPAGYAPSKDQYVFVGWYRDAELTKPFAMSDRVTQDLTLHARWEKRAAEADTGSVDVVVNGEQVDQQTRVVDVVRVPDVAPEHQETLQASEALTGKGEPAGFFELNLTVDGEVVEKATFGRPLPVEVAFPVEERTQYSIAHLRHDGSVELLDAEPDLAAQTLTFTVDSLSPFMVMAQKLCSVTFDSAGGSAVASLSNVEAGSHIAAPTEPAKNGYTFLGWSRDAAGMQPWDFARDVVDGDLTLHAIWKENVIPGPDEPVVPDVPDQPEDPDRPIVPERPDDPGDQDVPDDPARPEEPNGPDDSNGTGPETGDDGETGGVSAPDGNDRGSSDSSKVKPLPATLPTMGDALLSFAIACLALVAALSGCIALRTWRHRA